MEEIKNPENKSFWRKFNPTLKEMEERYPDISILGLWWSWYWRLALIIIGVWIVFVLITLVTSLLVR